MQCTATCCSVIGLQAREFIILISSLAINPTLTIGLVDGYAFMSTSPIEAYVAELRSCEYVKKSVEQC